MSVDRTPHHNDERYVVIVEARAFYALWLTTRDKNWGHAGIPANEGDFPNDRKWKYQERCWANTESNPVPLATVGCYTGQGTSLSFVV